RVLELYLLRSLDHAFRDVRALRCLGHRRLELLDLGRPAGLGRLERLGPDQHDCRPGVGFHRGELRTAEVRHLGDKSTVLPGDVAAVADKATSDPTGRPPRDPAGAGREPEPARARLRLL